MKIDFSFTTQYGTFSDSLYFDDNQPSPTQDVINAMQQERLNNWIAIITAPQPDTTTGV